MEMHKLSLHPALTHEGKEKCRRFACATRETATMQAAMFCDARHVRQVSGWSSITASMLVASPAGPNTELKSFCVISVWKQSLVYVGW